MTNYSNLDSPPRHKDTKFKGSRFKGSRLEIYQVFVSLFFVFFVTSCLCGFKCKFFDNTISNRRRK